MVFESASANRFWNFAARTPGVCAIGGCGGGDGECATLAVAISGDYFDKNTKSF